MKTNIDNLDKHLKTLWANINDNHLGGVFDILSDAMVELNMIRMKANGAEQSSSNCNIPLVSVSLIEQIKRQIKYHEESEKTRASVNDYGQALYHNHRRGALEDLLIWVKLNERSDRNEVKLKHKLKY